MNWHFGQAFRVGVYKPCKGRTYLCSYSPAYLLCSQSSCVILLVLARPTHYKRRRRYRILLIGTQVAIELYMTYHGDVFDILEYIYNLCIIVRKQVTRVYMGYILQISLGDHPSVRPPA